MVRGATHIAGNRLYLVMTDSPDVVDMSLGTPLVTSDHCFVNCELLVEQVIPEHNIRRVVHLKHRINWDNVRMLSGVFRGTPFCDLLILLVL